MKETTERDMPLFTSGTMILIFLILMGVIVAFIRFTQGLGATTNLSDKFPWGMWIGIDVLSGVALAAGGFVIAATVYIFNLKKYYPVLRPAVLTAFLGYLMVIVALIFDLGHPYRIWHPMVLWQHHSVMFEVGWCVMLYTTVLGLEISPPILERFNMQWLLKIIRIFTVPLVIAGVILSTLHQSSLGSLYLIVPNKLSSLWYTPLLPVMFFVSAVMVGLAMVIFESFVSSKAFKRKLEMDIILGLIKAEWFVLSWYLIIKIVDLIVRGSFLSIFNGSLESFMFLVEIIIGVVIPLLLLSIPTIRKSKGGIFISSLMIITGLVISKINVSIIGMLRESGANYFPALSEFIITISIIAGGLLAFKLAIKYFNIFSTEKGGDR